MPYTKRTSRKKHSNKFQKYLGFAIFVLVVALSPILIYSFVTPSKSTQSQTAIKTAVNVAEETGTKSDLVTQNADILDITDVEDASSELGGKWIGLCKKNSITSVKDFQTTVQNDAVLASHYSGFDWQNAWLGKQNEEVLAFVSHRKDGVIKKTSKPIRLPKGDGYITDGKQTARTFCCNDIILSPSAGLPPENDVSLEPSAGLPPMEEVALDPLPLLIPLEVAPLFIGDDPPRRFFFPPNDSNPDPIPEPTPDPGPEPVPEPGSLILFGTGLAVLAAAIWRKNSSNKHRE